MLNLLKSFLVPIVGGVIGYTTNWLAIKMIFKPHEPKYVFGIKIPFTPGVIAKERKRISKNIGKTLEEEVLTKDDLNKFLIDAKLGESIDTFFLDYIRDNNDLTIKSFVDEKFSIDTKQEVEKIIISNLENYINSEDFQKVTNILVEKTLEYISSEDVSSKVKLEINNIIDEVLNKVMDYSKSEDFHNYISNKLDSWFENIGKSEKTVEQSFKDVSLEIKHHIKNNLPKYNSVINEYLSTEASTDFHIEVKKLLQKMLKANLNPMFMGFIDIDSIYKSGIYKLNEYLDNEENYPEILYYVDGIVEKVVNQKVSKIVDNLPKETIKKEIPLVIKNAITSNEVFGMLLNTMKIDENYISSMLHKNKDSLEEVFYKFIKKSIESNVYEISEYITIKLININIPRLVDKYNFKISSLNNLDNIIFKITSFVVEKLEISNIVENKLNEIEINKVEEIILSVVQKELKYITMLGGLLGFIIGCITLIV